MHLPESTSKHEFENLLPLVNVVFLLLIFFMVAGAFTSPELFNISAPYAQEDTSIATNTLTIIMNEQGELAVGEEYVSQTMLPALINTYLEENSVSKVQIKADANAKADLLIDLLQELSTSDLDAVHILTTSTDAG